MRRKLLAGAVVAALVLSWVATGSAAQAELSKPTGSVVSTSSLPKSLWPAGTRQGWRITYISTDAHGKRTPVSGEILIPKGTAPKAGWPVLSWAHGTVGVADACAPSRVGPSLKERDFAYLSTWLSKGYAIVGTDYAGLGTTGMPAYLHGLSEAHNIVDIVAASRSFANGGPSWRHLSKRYAIIGQSQGGGAAIYSARYATEFGKGKLDYRGAVGTGTPANIEKVLLLLGPLVPPVKVLPVGIQSYIGYILASWRKILPELNLDSALTAEGKKYLALAEKQCVVEFEETVKATNIGAWFTKPLVTLPGYTETINQYLAMPTSGFDRPFFMANGLTDTDMPFAVALPYVLQLKLAGQPLEFHTYVTDHSATMDASLKHSVPFMQRIFK